MFYCKQCDWRGESALCPGCSHFLTTDGALIETFLADPPLPPRSLRWVTAFAHWGDTFGALSQAKYILDQQGGKSCSVLHIGHDPRIIEFCAAQPWVDRAMQLDPGPKFQHIYHLACERDTEPGAYWAHVERAAAEQGLEVPPAREVTPTHLIHAYGRSYRALPLRGAVLPEGPQAWAREWWAANTRHVPRTQRVFLLHPASIWSQHLAGHWPHWRQAVDWLLDETPHTYVLTGQERLIEREHSRLLDLTGQTPSNLEVLALAELAAGVISTCNNLSLWTVMQGIPGLVSGNEAIRNHSNYFRRFIDRPPNSFLPVEGTFAEWVTLAEPWLRDPRGSASEAQARWDAAQALLPPRQSLPPRPPLECYEVTVGWVSGLQKDFPLGSVVTSRDLGPHVRAYLDCGAIVPCEV